MGANSSLGAATQAGQQTEQANAGAVAGASGAADAASAIPRAPDGRPLTEAEIADRARAQGSAAGASSSLAANTASGQQNQQANAGAMAGASDAAAAAAKPDLPPPAPPAQPPTPEMVTAPEKTAPSLDDNMALYEKTAQDWMNGIVDEKVFRTTANRAILQMGLNNSAEMDALKMRINSDPSLAGQGAGSAMLSMMAANQNFNADQLFGQLAESAQQKILDMQKYGLEQGVRINTQRRENAYKSIDALKDAGDFTGAAKLLAKTVDFPGVSIDPSQFSASRSRQAEDIQSLMTAGNYQGAAEKLAALTGKPVSASDLQLRDPFTLQRAQDLEKKGDFEGAAKQYASMGINVTADDLRAQSPFMQTSWSNALDGIKAIATTNPAAAEAQLAILMKNPAAAKYLGFSASANPHDLIQAIVSGQYADDQSKIATLNTEINRQAKSGVSFQQALQNYKQQGPVAWEGMTNTGKQMAKGDLTSFNEARASLGMDAVHKDANGNIVDSHGTMLTDEDFAETAAAADYSSRQEQMKVQPWQGVYDQLMAQGSPFREKILSIPGGDTMVKQALMSSYLGGTYKIDPNTGLMQPDFTNGMPWDNPNTSYLFHDWPTAVFGDDFKVQGSFDAGGDPYGLESTDGQKLQKLPDDEHLDNLYAKYLYTGGKLNSTEWYFATAGGQTQPDPTRIPASVKSTTENQTNVGNTGDGTGTGDGTQPKPLDLTTGAGQVSAFTDYVNKTGGMADKEAFITSMTDLRDQASRMDRKTIGALADTADNQDLIRTAITYLKNHGREEFANALYSTKRVGSSFAGIGSEHDAYNTNQIGMDFAIYMRMLNQGMTEKDAKLSLAYLLGPQRAIETSSLLSSTDDAKAEFEKYKTEGLLPGEPKT